MALGHLLSKTYSENRKWRFQHLRRRVWPEERENRARSSQSPTSLLPRRFQWRLPFLQESFNFCRYTVVASKSVSDVMYPTNRPFFRMQLGYMSETSFAIYFYNFKLLFWRNGKRRWMRLGKRLVGLWEERARFSLYPGQIRLRRCWNLHFQF